MAFTSISAGVDWQAASVMRELQLGYIERAMAVGARFSTWASGISYSLHTLVKYLGDKKVYRCIEAHTSSSTFDPTKWEDWSLMEGKDLQGRIFIGEPYGNVLWAGWNSLQRRIEELVPNFVDHTVDLTTVGQPTMFTLASWRSAAGLPSSGWRRSTVVPWDGVSYGRMQTGDVIGNWIFEDIQKGLTALKWTRKNINFAITDAFTNGGIRLAGFNSLVDCPTARSGFDSAWAASTWGASSSAYYQARKVSWYSLSPLFWQFDAQRIRSQPKIPSTSPIEDNYFNHTAECWLKATLAGSGWSDLDGITNGQNLLWLHQSFPASTNTIHTCNYVGNNNTNPNPDACPLSPGTVNVGAEARDASWILKWSFTN